MTKYIKILFSLLLALFMGSCSDDFQWEGVTVGSDEYLIAFTTAPEQLQLVNGTRAYNDSRDAIQNLTLVIFKDGVLWGEPQYFYPTSSGYVAPSSNKTGSLTLKKSKVTDGEWFLVANAESEIRTLYTEQGTGMDRDYFLTNIKYGYAVNPYMDQLTETDYNNQPIPHVMRANHDITVGEDDSSQADVKVFNLERIYSRLSVKINKEKLPFIMTGACVSRVSETGDLACSQTGKTLWSGPVSDTGTQWISTPLSGKLNNNGTEISYATTSDVVEVSPSYPYKAPENSTNKMERIMIIVKGYFNHSKDATKPQYGSPCYYAIPVPDLQANHHYQMQINGAPSEGESSASAAEDSPGGLSVEFKDKTPEIRNIISDGENVLAVQDTVFIESGANVAGNAAENQTWSLPVMMRTAKDKDAEIELEPVSVSYGEAWFSISDESYWTHKDISETIESNNGLLTDAITVKGTALGNLGTERQEVYRVKLKGTKLEREVVFVQRGNANLKLSNYVRIKLEIVRNYTTIYTINDYLSFINPDEGAAPATGRCQGIQPSENGGRVRNLGLHSPMPNGDNVQYRYLITPLNENVKIDGYNTEMGYTYSDYTPPVYGGDKYEYVVTPDEVTIDTGFATVKLPRYHTGFFHNDGSSWYYYEVMTQDDKNLHWLDRNLGATSSGMGVRTNSSTVLNSSSWPITGDKAMGNRYNRAEALAACPTGWEIPSYAQMRSLTVSPSFNTNQMTTVPAQTPYFAPTFSFKATENGVVKRIQSYFPQNMKLYNGVVDGDSEAGYYLTTTSAGSTGWYQTMQFVGMNVTSENTDMSKTKMSVRCCAGSYDPQTEATTYKCSVQGYTHVFLYHLNTDGSKTYLTNWPGEQIAVYSDISRFHAFEFTPAMDYDSDRIYVIFNKVKANGEREDSNVSEDKVARREGIKFNDGDSYTSSAVHDTSTGADQGHWLSAFEEQKPKIGVRVLDLDIYPDQDYLYAWNGSNIPFGAFTNATERTGRMDGYRYWIAESDLTSLEGVIFKNSKTEDGDRKTGDLKGSKIKKETDPDLLAKYKVDALFTIDASGFVEEGYYGSYKVEISGPFADNWNYTGVMIRSNGGSLETDAAIGQKGFKIAVNNNSDWSSKWFTTGGPIETDKWIDVSEDVWNENPQMTIIGAKANDKFDVEWDYNKNKLKVTKK